MPSYLHGELVRVAREQGVSLNQFVYSAAVMAAGLNTVAPPLHEGYDRVGDEEYSRIVAEAFA
jgi:hypothetical protein